MAKRKKHHHKKPVRRHSRGRIGAVGNHGIMGMMETALGLVGGNMAGVMIQKHFTALPAKIICLAEIGFGLMHANSPNKLLSGAAYGLAGAGATGLAHDTGILRGVDEVVSGFFGGEGYNGFHDEEMHLDHQMSGMRNETTLSGMANSTTLGDPLAEGGGRAPMNDYANYVPVMGY